MKKLMVGAFFTVFVVSGLVFVRDRASAVWNAPVQLTQLEEQYQKSYEQQVRYTEELQKANQQQQVINAQNQEKLEQQKVEDDRQWQAILQLLNGK